MTTTTELERRRDLAYAIDQYQGEIATQGPEASPELWAKFHRAVDELDQLETEAHNHHNDSETAAVEAEATQRGYAQ